jgi:hypothetical protein
MSIASPYPCLAALYLKIAAISWILDHYLLATNAYSNKEYKPIIFYMVSNMTT